MSDSQKKDRPGFPVGGPFFFGRRPRAAEALAKAQVLAKEAYLYRFMKP
jgi:hypothetical protein